MRLRPIAAMLYWGFAIHLPWSPRPGGGLAKRVRAALAGRMLDYCGTDVNIEKGAWFGSGNGIRVGDRSAIGLDCLVIGPLNIGNDVMMGPRCCIIARNHEFASTAVPMAEQGFSVDRPVVVENDVWIGANVTILPGTVIGHGSIVAAGAVVTKDVPPYSVVGGNPARILRSRHAD